MKKLGISKIRITGGEPLVKKGVVDLLSGSKKLGIEEITMTTNGILLKDKIKELKEAGLNRVNISLDSLDKKKYFDITRGGNLQDILDSIQACKENGNIKRRDKRRS